MSASRLQLRHEVLRVYKELLHLGRGYPLGFPYFRSRLHRAFTSKKNLTEVAEVEKSIRQAQHVKKEIEALYYLKRYRTLRQRYGDT